MEQFRLPKIPMPELIMPRAIQEVLQEAEEKLAHRPKLLQLFKNCFRIRWRQRPNYWMTEQRSSLLEIFPLRGCAIQ